MKRKVIVGILALVMGLSLTACGSADSGSEAAAVEGVTVSAREDGSVAADTAPADWPVIKVEVCSFTDTLEKEPEIEAALNEYLVSINAGVQADMLPIAIGDRSTQLTLMLTDNKDPIDLFAWRFYSSVSDMVKNGQCISLEK